MVDIKVLILEVLEKKQKRMMMNDLFKEVKKRDKDIKKKDLKNATTEMINNKIIAYWSSGSTTYFALPGTKVPVGEN